MFKKVVSIALAALMMVGTTAFAVSAVEADNEAVAADDSVSVGADSSETAGADSSETAGADSSETTGASPSANSIWFKVNTNDFKTFKTIYCYMYMIGDGATDVTDSNGKKLNSWGTKACKMEDGGDGYWYMDFDARGISFDSSRAYACIFTADWAAQTCDLLFDTPCYGKDHAATTNGEVVENSSDSNKKSYLVHWAGVDNSLYAPPLQITSIGNIIGEAVPKGETKYSLFVTFLSTTDEHSLQNALKFNGKTEQQTIDDVAKAFGLGKDDVQKAVDEANKKLKDKGEKVTVTWDASKSSLPGGSTGEGGSSSNNNSSNNSSSNNSSSNSSSSNSSSSTSTTGSSSVTSGQETTIFFVFGGVMLAAAGVIFLARKRRED